MRRVMPALLGAAALAAMSGPTQMEARIAAEYADDRPPAPAVEPHPRRRGGKYAGKHRASIANRMRGR